MNLTILNVDCDQDCKKRNALAEVVRETNAKTFGVISIDLNVWAEVARATNTVWNTRINHLWMMPKFFASDETFAHQHQWILDYVERAFAADLHKNKPDIVFVDDTEKFYDVHKKVDLIRYFSANAEFRSAWENYQYVKSVNLCKVLPKRNAVNAITYKKNNCKFDLYRRPRQS